MILNNELDCNQIQKSLETDILTQPSIPKEMTDTAAPICDTEVERRITLKLPDNILESSELKSPECTDSPSACNIKAPLVRCVNGLRSDLDYISQTISTQEQLLEEKRQEEAELKKILRELESKLEKYDYQMETETQSNCISKCVVF